MTTRTTDTALHHVFLDRWSPRAFDGSDLPEADLATILDAARFAPSSMNRQPWRFLYARRGDENWDRFIGCLMPGNQVWAKNASVLFFVVSEKTMGSHDKPSHSHSFDAGCAWGMMAIQATMLGYHTHGMTGVDFPKTARELQVPDDYRVEAAIALGTMGDPADLPQALQEREYISGRKERHEIGWPGNFRE